MESIFIRAFDLNDLEAVARLHMSAFSDRVPANLSRVAVRRFYEKLGWQKVLDGDGCWHGSMRKELEEAYG
jgi:hypothetical protein